VGSAVSAVGGGNNLTVIFTPKGSEETTLENRIELGADSKTLANSSVNGLLPLWLFFSLSAVLSWTAWLWPVQQNGFVYLAFLRWRIEWPLTNLKLVIGNCLPGILALVWALAQGKRSFLEILSTLVAWRTPLRWYALAVGFPCGVFITSLSVALVCFPMKHAWPPLSVFFGNFPEPAVRSAVGGNSLESLCAAKAPIALFVGDGRFDPWSVLGNLARSVVAHDLEPDPRSD